MAGRSGRAGLQQHRTAHAISPALLLLTPLLDRHAWRADAYWRFSGSFLRSRSPGLWLTDFTYQPFSPILSVWKMSPSHYSLPAPYLLAYTEIRVPVPVYDLRLPAALPASPLPTRYPPPPPPAALRTTYRHSLSGACRSRRFHLPQVLPPRLPTGPASITTLWRARASGSCACTWRTRACRWMLLAAGRQALAAGRREATRPAYLPRLRMSLASRSRQV